MLCNDDKTHLSGLIHINHTMFLFVIIHSYGILLIVYDIFAILMYSYGLPSTMVTKNKQLVHRPYVT